MASVPSSGCSQEVDPSPPALVPDTASEPGDEITSRDLSEGVVGKDVDGCEPEEGHGLRQGQVGGNGGIEQSAEKSVDIFKERGLGDVFGGTESDVMSFLVRDGNSERESDGLQEEELWDVEEKPLVLDLDPFVPEESDNSLRSDGGCANGDWDCFAKFTTWGS